MDVDLGAHVLADVGNRREHAQVRNVGYETCILDVFRADSEDHLPSREALERRTIGEGGVIDAGGGPKRATSCRQIAEAWHPRGSWRASR